MKLRTTWITLPFFRLLSAGTHKHESHCMSQYFLYCNIFWLSMLWNNTGIFSWNKYKTRSVVEEQYSWFLNVFSFSFPPPQPSLHTHTYQLGCYRLKIKKSIIFFETKIKMPFLSVKISVLKFGKMIYGILILSVEIHHTCNKCRKLTVLQADSAKRWLLNKHSNLATCKVSAKVICGWLTVSLWTQQTHLY